MRILGIEPTSKGLGFAVLEDNGKLVAWGVKYLPQRCKRSKGSCKNAKLHHEQYLPVVESLISFYEPTVAVFEEWATKDCHRSFRMKRVLHYISHFMAERRISSYSFTRSKAKDFFAQFEVQTNHQVAEFLCRLFPELLLVLPRKRKTWMNESVWMNMFRALAYCFQLAEKS